MLTTEDGPVARRAMVESKPLMVLRSSRPLQLILVEAVLIGYFFVASNGAFLNELNIRGMLITGAQVLLLAVAQAILMSAGHIDISQGAVLVLSAVVGGQAILYIQQSASPVVAIVLGAGIAIVTGLVVGVINGVMVAVVRVNALVTTLAMLGIATGIARVSTGGINLTGLPRELQTLFGQVTVGPVPLAMIVSLSIIGVIWLLYKQTHWGTHVLAMGSNLRAARRVGIRTTRQTVLLFALSSAMAGFAGFIDLARYSTTNIDGHTEAAIAAIAAALIGGTLLTGGRINFAGAMLGAFLAIILQSGLVIINLSPFYQTIAVGVMLLVAVSVDSAARKRSPDE